ncbi:MAG: trigger factor [Oscillospiraceae bacterium]|nr:trigger factor [Oscillospiraceae bacterium]
MSLVSSKNVETNRVELVIEVKGEEFAAAVENAFRKNIKKITIPGFRKGKAPRAMVEKLYGKAAFLDDAINEVYPKAYTEAVDEAGINPVDVADIEIVDVSEESFTFKAYVTVKPKAKVNNYKGLAAPKTEAVVAEEKVEDQLEQLRERYARVINVEDRAAKLGDIANIDFEGFLEGVAFEGGKGEGHPLTLGSGSFIPGFEDQVIGHSIGEEFDVNVTFPEEYGESTLAGKAATFKVKLNGIQERQLPDLDDEFAKDISEFDTLEQYKEDMRAKMLKSAQAAADADFENALLAQVVANMEVEVPNCMIDARIDDLVQDFAFRMSQQGLKLEDFLRYTGETIEKFRDNFRGQAESQVKTRLAMEAIAEAEGIEVTEADVEEEFKSMAEQYGMDIEKIREMVPAKELSGDIACRKAIEVVVANAVVEAAAEEEKAAPKKRATKKAAPKAEEAAEGEAAPKKRTTKKAAAKTEEAAEGEEAPKKRTRKPKAEAAE